MKLAGLTILLISNEPWGDVWFSKHHYAVELAKRNTVVFLDPPLKWGWRALLGPRFRLAPVLPGLSVLRYRNILPRAVVGPAFSLNGWLITRALGSFLRQAGQRPDIILTFDPFRSFEPRALGARREIYYIVDDYGTPTERAVLRVADTLLAVSGELAVRDQDEKRRVAHVIPHGVRDHGIGEDELIRPSLGKDIITCGTFNIRTDFAILLAVAKHFRESVLRLVGPVVEQGLSKDDHERIEELRRLPNVVFAGVKPYHDMGRDIAAAAAGICAYKKPKSAAEQSSVLKNIQYLSFGKPVVSTIVNSYSTLQPRFVWMARDQDDFINALDTVLSAPHDPELIRARIAFTKDLSYAKLIERIENILA